MANNFNTSDITDVSYTSVTTSGNATVGGYLTLGGATASVAGTIALLQASGDAFSSRMTGIAHGMTTLAATDQFVTLDPVNDSTGGVRFTGYSASTRGNGVLGYVATESTAELTTSDACVELQGAKKSGTTVAALGSTGNIAMVRNLGSAVVFFKGDGSIVMAGDLKLATGKTITSDGVALSNLKWVHATVTAAALDSAGSVTVAAAATGDTYRIREVFLVGGGTSFGAGGDRNISLTDNTTTWTTVANADIESAPAATLRWGDAKVPFLTGTSATASASGTAIVFKYSGGTTDHGGTGSIVFSVCLEKIT